MQGFNGFPQKGTLTKIPGTFFSELLPQIDHLGEMKVTLHCFWRLQQKEGQVVFLHKRELLEDLTLLAGLAARDDQQREALDDALERAIARGTLLHVHAEQTDHADDLYFMNTAKGRAAVAGIEQGKWVPHLDTGILAALSVDRPNIFRLYEQNIGPLTPLIADHLTEMEGSYPQAWIEEAIGISVRHNKAKLAYIEAILKRWRIEGRAGDKQLVRDEQRFTSDSDWDEIES